MKINLKVITIAVLILVIACGGYYYYTKEEKIKASYEAMIAENLTMIKDLQTQINYTGELTTVYELNTDVTGGTIIDESNLTEVEMPVAMTSNCPTSLEEVKGMYYLFDIQKGQILSYNQMMNFQIDDTMRELDIVCDEVPIGLSVGDYVDVNISFTMGQNFVGMTHKRVLGINGNIVKIIVDSKDVHVYEGMKVDKGVYSGTKIYAMKYVEGTAQLSGLDFYPVSLYIMTTLLQDPNVTMDFSSLSTADRETLELQLNRNVEYLNELMDTVDRAKEALSRNYSSSKNAFDRQVEQEAKDAQKEAEKAAKEAEKQRVKSEAAAKESNQVQESTAGN